MKNYLWLIPLLFIAACNNEVTPDETTESTPKHSETLYAESEITDYILDHYHKNFKQHKQERLDADNSIEVSYLGKIDDDVEDHWLISINVPTGSSNKAIYNGDLNNDGQSDKVLAVHTEGGGGGGNSSSTDYFIFTSQDGKYAFQSVQSSGELSGCTENYGYFIAKKIEDNLLKGETYCYAEDDGRCCPSLHYDTELSLENGKLILQKKTESPAPEDDM